MRLFRSRAFSGINAASLLMFLGMFGSIFLLSQYMQGVLGYSPTEAGLRMLPWTGMPMLVAPIAGILSDRIGGRRSSPQASSCRRQASATCLRRHHRRLLRRPAARPDPQRHRHGPVLRAGLQPGHVQRPPAGTGHRLRANNALREVGGALGIAVMASIFSAQAATRPPRPSSTA